MYDMLQYGFSLTLIFPYKDGNYDSHFTKNEVSVKDFFSKYDQIRSFLRIWSHLLKKSLMKNYIFCVQCLPVLM